MQATTTPSPFRGPESLRVRGERGAFWGTLASLPITIVVLGWIFQHQITWQQLSLLLVVAMIYVSFARGRSRLGEQEHLAAADAEQLTAHVLRAHRTEIGDEARCV